MKYFRKMVIILQPGRICDILNIIAEVFRVVRKK